MTEQTDSLGAFGRLRRWLVNGVVITIPLVITLLIASVAIDFLLGALSPIVDLVLYLWPNQPPTIVVQAATLASLLGVFVAVGFAAEHVGRGGLTDRIDAVIDSVPLVGSIYTSFRRVSDILLEDESESFQDVKLVEFPHQDAYALAFLTADTPETIRDDAGHEEMRTVMMPLGPNPTTNGFIMHVPDEHVHDTDLTVEDAIETTATLGVTTGGDDEEEETTAEPEASD